MRHWRDDPRSRESEDAMGRHLTNVERLCVVLTDTPRYVSVMYLAPPTNRVRTKRELQPNNDSLAPLVLPRTDCKEIAPLRVRA